MTTVTLVDPTGHPLPSSRKPRLAAMDGNRRAGGFGRAPYDAADIYGEHMQAWRPYLWSPDGELNPYRDRIVARVRDLVRNDGWAAGSVTRILDNAIGSNFRPISRPNYKWLAAYAGNPAFDHVWAKEWAAAVDANWAIWTDDPGRYCDSARNMFWANLMWVGFRHELIDGDALAILKWMPERVSRGRARYATAVQMIDPDRLSNPQLQFDQQTMRGGVQVDQDDVAVGYWIRKAHQGDWFNAAKAMTWELVPRETAFGRPIVVHHFMPDRAGQHRGGAGIFTPVLDRLKMLIKYDATELDSAIINAIFAAYVESPMDPQMVKQAMGAGEEDDEYGDELRLSGYQEDRLQYARENGIMLGGARIPHLYPGEAIRTVSAARPSANFDAFEAAALRNIAAGTGLSAQQVSNDWSKVNYSSARAAMLEAWKTLARRRAFFGRGFAGPIRSAWLEEAMEVDRLPMPSGIVPEYIECRAAYARCRWMGPGRGWVDPVAERQGSVLGMDAALTTLQDECAEQGLDFEEVLEQRKHEIELMEKMGIPKPEWAAGFAAQQTIKKPDAE